MFNSNNTVKRIEYRESKSFILPPALLERLIILEDEIQTVNTLSEVDVEAGKGKLANQKNAQKWVGLKNVLDYVLNNR